MNLVMDANALIAYLNGEPGGKIVDALLMDVSNDCYVHAVNLCEVYYDFRRSDGEVEAERVITDLMAAGLELREGMDGAFWRLVGSYKADHARVSLGDCFCVALADRTGAEIVTADHHEFDALVSGGVCRVRFIR